MKLRLLLDALTLIVVLSFVYSCDWDSNSAKRPRLPDGDGRSGGACATCEFKGVWHTPYEDGEWELVVKESTYLSGKRGSFYHPIVGEWTTHDDSLVTIRDSSNRCVNLIGNGQRLLGTYSMRFESRDGDLSLWLTAVEDQCVDRRELVEGKWRRFVYGD